MLSVINIDECFRWDSIVKSFRGYDVNYLSGYAKAFMINGDGEPLLFYYDNGKTRAINVVMKRDISELPAFKGKIPSRMWYDISTPYGYGGFLIDGEDSDAVNEAYNTFCINNGFVCEFVRFHLINNYQNNYSGISETHTHNIIRSLELDIDEIYMDYEQKVRKNLRRANESNLYSEIDTSGARLDDFLEIYYSTMDRTNANGSYFFKREFFDMINKMVDNYVYVHVLSEGKVISTELVLYGSENCYSFLGGTNKDFFHLRPNDFLKHEIVKWAKAKGLKRFILGGGYGNDDGIFKYKKSLAPHGIFDFYIGKKIFNKEKYITLLALKQDNLIVDMTEDDLISGFFPQYRA